MLARNPSPASLLTSFQRSPHPRLSPQQPREGEGVRGRGKPWEDGPAALADLGGHPGPAPPPEAPLEAKDGGPRGREGNTGAGKIGEGRQAKGLAGSCQPTPLSKPLACLSPPPSQHLSPPEPTYLFSYLSVSFAIWWGSRNMYPFILTPLV